MVALTQVPFHLNQVAFFLLMKRILEQDGINAHTPSFLTNSYHIVMKQILKERTLYFHHFIETSEKILHDHVMKYSQTLTTNLPSDAYTVDQDGKCQLAISLGFSIHPRFLCNNHEVQFLNLQLSFHGTDEKGTEMSLIHIQFYSTFPTTITIYVQKMQILCKPDLFLSD